MKRLLSYIGKYKIYAGLAAAASIAEVVLDVYIPRLMASIVDQGIGTGDIPFIWRTGGLMALAALGALIVGALAGYFASVSSMGFAANLRDAMFERVQSFSFSNIDKFSGASLITRLTSDVTNVQNSFMMIIRAMIRSPVMLISATLMAVTINRKLSLIFFVALPVLAVSLGLLGAKAFPLFNKMLKKYDLMNSSVQENLIAIRTVKSFVREGFEKKKFNDTSDDVRKTQRMAEVLLALSSPGMQLVMYACTVAILWFGGKMIIRQEFLTGDLISFFTYLTQVLMSLIMLSMVFIMIIMSRASAGRIAEVLNEQTDIKDPEDAIDEIKDGSIKFDNVSFSYKSENEVPVLSNINIDIKSGETIGIIGGTGSSKTSLVSLIPRFYDVTSGNVSVGGEDVRKYSVEKLRDAVSMVLQVNTLFSGTIKENIKWGDENADDQQVINACKAAQAHDFIMSTPDGYDTMVEQGGVNFSGGQKQRLCIARALLKKPKILILDDSTSAVDTATDLKIREAFRREISDSTKIIIAQRIQSVADADRIIVMDDGKINAIGTHEELLKSNKIYSEIYTSQQRGEE